MSGNCKKQRHSKDRKTAEMNTFRNKVQRNLRALKRDPNNYQAALWLVEKGITPKNITRYL